MTIREIISNHYDELHSYCSADKVISLSKTEEDILQDVCMTACRKFKENDISEKDGISYLKKTLFTELHFQYPRKKGEILLFTDTLPDIDGGI